MKRCTNSIILKFFNATLRTVLMNVEEKSVEQKNGN